MHLTGQKHAFWQTPSNVDTYFDPEAEVPHTPRAVMKRVPVSRRKEDFSEVELPFMETTALCEAQRCMRCDYRHEKQIAQAQ